MDILKISKYQDIVIDILKEEIGDETVNSEYQIIADKERNHYELVCIGWKNNQYTSSILLHFDIKSDGKIWIQANFTDLEVGKELVSKGVPPSDIVLGFHAPEYRKYTAFAVA